MPLPKSFSPAVTDFMAPGLGQAVSPVLKPIVYDAATVAWAAACAAGGSPVSDRRQSRHSRLMARMRQSDSFAKATGFYLMGDTETQFLPNQKSPGTYDLVKVGTPTFEPGEGVSTSAIGSYYDTGIPLNSLNRDDVTMYVFIANGANTTAPSSSNATAYDCGALDGTGGLAIHTYLSTDNKAHFRCFGTDQAAGTNSSKGIWRGIGGNSVTRVAADKIRVGKNGVVMSEDASTAVTSSVSTTITLLKANGSTNRSVRKIAAFYVGAALTDDQLLEMSAAIKDYLDCVKHGDPMIQRIGHGDTLISKDVIVYGLSMAAICHAYECARLGLSVALVGDWQDETIWALGGMPANGLTWIDCENLTTVQGIFMDITIEGRERCHVGFTGAPSTQSQHSIDSRDFNLMVRRMLDPTRTDGTRLPGMDITVYMTGGINGATKVGTEIKSFTTYDGRTFFGKQFHDGSYDGDLVYYSGCPYRIGLDAAGTGIESYSGFDPNRLSRPTASGTAVNVDPYATAGNASSGYVANVRVPTGQAPGTLDLSHQSMNYRMTVQVWDAGTPSLPQQRCGTPLLSVTPPGYSAAKYESLGRAFKAASDAGLTYALADVITYSGGTYDTYDVNNGGQNSIDQLNSGTDYVLAGAHIPSRRAVVDNLYSYQRGYLKWLRDSGDTRIPAAISTFIQNMGLDTWAHLDPPARRGGIGWPGRCYIRDTTYMLNASFTLDANDVAMVDGTTPRSIKTISTISYRRDNHARRAVDDNGVWKAQGALSDSTSGGTAACGANAIAPWPFEASVPDRSVCTNLSTSTAPSMTKLAWASARMENSMAQAGQVLAHFVKLAIAGNNVIQDVDYATARASALTNPYTRQLTLPQVN